ncbi:uncharacterized protein LOC115695088 [Cannabis sativa]|uniref:uncharacterized protein LOC115695088 n=1 Tax=Cannabis sativa TaxID=3483 RepID=UPI0011E02AAB|nr:uncharacterized protein LOC115695088 [Cannabis sativa]
MELCGYPFTWERGRGTSIWIEVRLGKGLADLAWLQMFNSAKLYNLEISTSDYSPILLELFTTAVQQQVTRFHFENAWLREPFCYQLIEDCWDDSGDVEVQQKIQRCGQRLVVWGKEFTGNFKERIQQCKNEVQKWKLGRDDTSVANYKLARNNLNEAYTQREVFWHPRSKQLWLQEGDNNSNFFHAFATNRRRNNFISKLKDSNGNWVDWSSGLPQIMVDYFCALFASSNANWREVTSSVQARVTAE